MTTPTDSPVPVLDISETTSADRALIVNLYQYYLYDFSEMIPLDVQADGRYGDGDLDECWVNPRRHTLLLSVDGVPAGLAIVDEVPEARRSRDETLDMAEFFVMRKFRRRGVGKHFAWALFDRFPGKWRVAQITENPAALAFWRRVIAAYTGENYDDTTWEWRNRTGTAQYFEHPGRR